MPDSKIPSQGRSQFTQFSSPTTPGYEFRAETDKGNLLRIKLQPQTCFENSDTNAFFMYSFFYLQIIHVLFVNRD